MNKKIKVSYPVIENMGDILNEYVIRDIFGYEVEKADRFSSDLSAIGSGLGSFLYNGHFAKKCYQFFKSRQSPSLKVWGTGFIAYSIPMNSFFRTNVTISAVRGELTRKRIESILGEPLNIPTGDGGLLSSFLLHEKQEKKYDVGIIAHFKEQDEPAFAEMVKHYPNSTFIDVKHDPITVIKHIAQCKTIISSSLHGLILADSLHIPNIHVRVSDKLMGDGYKFDDYYSGYNIDHRYITYGVDDLPSLKWVVESYTITPEMVEQKKKDLITAFPFQHSATYEKLVCESAQLV